MISLDNAIELLSPVLKAYAREDLACGGDAHHAVVGERLGILPGTAKQQKSRTKQQLRVIIESSRSDEE